MAEHSVGENTLAGPPLARSPLQGWSERFAVLGGRASGERVSGDPVLDGPAITLAEVPFLAMVNVRVAPASAAADAIEAALGVALPVDPARTVVGDELRVIWLAPDEFLVVGAPDTAAALVETIRNALGTEGAAVDVSAQRTTIALSGPSSRDLLAGGCSTDLSADVAPTGTSVQTLLAQAAVIILVTDADAGSFLLLVRSSFADYLAGWLSQGALEFA